LNTKIHKDICVNMHILSSSSKHSTLITTYTKLLVSEPAVHVCTHVDVPQYWYMDEYIFTWVFIMNICLSKNVHNTRCDPVLCECNCLQRCFQTDADHYILQGPQIIQCSIHVFSCRPIMFLIIQYFAGD
jgi:hypothetical protein